MEEVTTTKHSQQRMKERCGLQKKSKDRMAQIAYNNGVPHSKTKGRLRKWVDSVYFKNETANNIRIYGEHAYIFCNTRLVTVLNIPTELRKDLKKMIIND